MYPDHWYLSNTETELSLELAVDAVVATVHGRVKSTNEPASVVSVRATEPVPKLDREDRSKGRK